MAAKFADAEGVTIAKVDCTAEGNTNKELCDGQDVRYHVYYYLRMKSYNLKYNDEIPHL